MSLLDTKKLQESNSCQKVSVFLSLGPILTRTLILGHCPGPKKTKITKAVWLRKAQKSFIEAGMNECMAVDAYIFLELPWQSSRFTLIGPMVNRK